MIKVASNFLEKLRLCVEAHDMDAAVQTCVKYFDKYNSMGNGVSPAWQRHFEHSSMVERTLVGSLSYFVKSSRYLEDAWNNPYNRPNLHYKQLSELHEIVKNLIRFKTHFELTVGINVTIPFLLPTVIRMLEDSIDQLICRANQVDDDGRFFGSTSTKSFVEVLEQIDFAPQEKLSIKLQRQMVLAKLSA